MLFQAYFTPMKINFSHTDFGSILIGTDVKGKLNDSIKRLKWKLMPNLRDALVYKHFATGT